MLDESQNIIPPQSASKGSVESSSANQPPASDLKAGIAALPNTSTTNEPVRLRQSFFNNSNGVSTTGGQFLNGTNVNLSNNTYNYYVSGVGDIGPGQFRHDAEPTVPSKPKYAESHTGNYPAYLDLHSPPIINHGNMYETYNRGVGDITAGQFQQDAQMTLLPVLDCSQGHSVDSRPPSFPVLNGIDIYGRHLAVKKRGYPLWIPDPDASRPLEYQRQGISIGDVGIITASGYFDFKFNICQPGNHPVNVDEVPDDFEPFKPTLKLTDIRRNRDIKVDGFIASDSVSKLRRREGGNEGSESHGLAFQATATEGAILAVPNGALSEDLRNVVGFRRYISANLLSWYRSIKSRGCDVKNGDIRLVIGTDKTTTWGMAAFSSLSDRKDNFYLNLRPSSQGSRGAMYDWDCSGTSEAKAGPDAFDIDALRGEDEQDGEPPVYCNQCMFVRTLNPMLRDDIWKMLESEFELAQDTTVVFDNTGSQSFDSRPHPPASFDSLNAPSQRSQDQNSFRRHTNTFVTQSSINVARAVRLAELSMKQVEHPSRALNEVLLKRYPSLEIVITEDNNWIDAIAPVDKMLPSPKELVSRILSKNIICQEEGVLFLKAVPTLPNSELKHSISHAATHNETDAHTPGFSDTESVHPGLGYFDIATIQKLSDLNAGDIPFDSPREQFPSSNDGDEWHPTEYGMEIDLMSSTHCWVSEPQSFEDKMHDSARRIFHIQAPECKPPSPSVNRYIELPWTPRLPRPGSKSMPSSPSVKRNKGGVIKSREA